MKYLCTSILMFLLTGTTLFAQNDFYFKKWFANKELRAKSITLVMDTTDSKEDWDFVEAFGHELSKQLDSLGLVACYEYFGDQYDKRSLHIEFDLIAPAFMKLNNSGVSPKCNRFKIRQLNFSPLNPKAEIKTMLIISRDNQENGILQAASAMALHISLSMRPWN